MQKTFLLLFLLTINTTWSQGDILWEFQTKDRVYSSPIVDGAILFIGSNDHSLYALDKYSGHKIWEFKTDGGVKSTPLVINNIVYFSSADGNLYAVDKANGKLRWKFQSEGEKMYDLWDYYISSPQGDEKTIYWGSSDGNVYAIEVSNGQLKWKFHTEGIVHASPVIYENRIFIGSFDGTFYCLEKDDGSLVWKFKTIGAEYFPKGEIQKAALVKDDVVYFGSRDYNIYALDANTGMGKWNMRQPSGWIIATPLVYKENVYFGTSDAHQFYSMHKDYGNINWTIPVGMRVYGSAIAHNNNIYFGTFDGKIIGIDYLTGERNWEFQTANSKSNYSSIFSSEGTFKEGFELYGNGFEESEALIHSLGSILCTPAIDGQTIYFGSSNGNIYGVKLK